MCVRSHNTVLMSSGISYVPVFLMRNLAKKGMDYSSCNHIVMLQVAGGVRYAAMHQGSPATHPQEVTSACLSGFALKQAEIHSPFTKDAAAQLRSSHTCLRAVTSLIALEIPRRGYLATSWRKEMPGAREGLCSLWKERWEMKANTHSSPAVMGLLVNRTASGIPFAKHSLGQAPLLAPIPSLSQNFLSPYSFLYTQYLLYGMERHLQHCNNHVMLCTEIWGEAHLCSTMLVFVCICVCIVNKKKLV